MIINDQRVVEAFTTTTRTFFLFCVAGMEHARTDELVWMHWPVLV